MSLETIITALGKFMKNEVTAADAPLYENLEVRSVMQTYVTEQHARPDLVALIRAPSLMYEYLSLSLEEREKLETFRGERPEYLEGEGNGNYWNSRGDLISKSAYTLLRKVRCVSQVLKLFDFYLQYRKEGNFLGPNTLRDKLVDKSIKNLSYKVSSNVRKYFGEGFKELIRITSECRPEILKHTTPKDVFLIDGPQQLIRVFDYYLKNKKDGQKFLPHYILTNEDLNRDLQSLGRRVSLNATRHLPGGINELVRITERIRPEIKEYWSSRPSLSFNDLVKRFVDGFERWYKNDREKLPFNIGYLKKIGICIDTQIRRISDWDSILKEAIKINPIIREYWEYSPKKKKPLGLSSDALMQVILKNPGIPSEKAYELAELSGYFGFRAKKSLLNQSIIRIVKIRTNSGRAECLEAIDQEPTHAS